MNQKDEKTRLKLALFKKFSMIGFMTSGSLQKLKSKSKNIAIKYGQTLFTQGQKFDSIYLLCFGDFIQTWHGKDSEMDDSVSAPVATHSPFGMFGLEEWISGSDTWLTTTKCVRERGVCQDPELAEIYAHFYEDCDQVCMKAKGNRPVTFFFSAMLLKISIEDFKARVAHRQNIGL
jgi:hypothetical protein